MCTRKEHSPSYVNLYEPRLISVGFSLMERNFLVSNVPMATLSGMNCWKQSHRLGCFTSQAVIQQTDTVKMKRDTSLSSTGHNAAHSCICRTSASPPWPYGEWTRISRSNASPISWNLALRLGFVRYTETASQPFSRFNCWDHHRARGVPRWCRMGQTKWIVQFGDETSGSQGWSPVRLSSNYGKNTEVLKTLPHSRFQPQNVAWDKTKHIRSEDMTSEYIDYFGLTPDKLKKKYLPLAHLLETRGNRSNPHSGKRSTNERDVPFFHWLEAYEQTIDDA